jgi:hypothetical protein
MREHGFAATAPDDWVAYDQARFRMMTGSLWTRPSSS